MRRIVGMLAAAVGLLAATAALAEPTTVTVRAISRDAKFIGTGMGGVRVRLFEADSNRLLAEGTIAGGTGDTDRLVVKPRVRGERLSGEGDGAFTTVLDIDRPTLVRLEATGPLAPEGAAIQVSAMAWVLPGKGTVGDGWVVEFPGLAILPGLDAGTGVLTAKVTLMCGCPLTPGGLWDADKVEVIAWLTSADGPPRRVALSYAGQPSTFTATLTDAPKVQSITVTAYDRGTGNTGVARLTPGATRP